MDSGRKRWKYAIIKIETNLKKDFNLNIRD